MKIFNQLAGCCSQLLNVCIVLGIILCEYTQSVTTNNSHSDLENLIVDVHKIMYKGIAIYICNCMQ